MNTIKIILAESGRTAELLKDFPLYKGQYNNKLLNILVPTSILAPQFDIQHYIGQMSGAVAPSTAELDAFVEANTYPERESLQGDIIEFYNTTSTNYYLYEFDGEEWGATEVNSFGTFITLAGTSVKVGMIAVKRDGKIYESKSYFLRYLKTLTYQGTEYALYERKLPKEFTAIAGQGENAPTIVSNVVNVDTQTNEILSLITSQTCKLDVMMSTVLDQDEPVEASDLETLEAEVNENSAKIALKQDKIDNSLSTTQKNVVGGINEVNSLANTNKSNIETNTQDIAQNKSDIAYLYSHIAQPEEYIGQMQGTSLPTNTELNEFVETTVDREPKNADVIIFILEVTGGTDKNYKYTYAVDGWNGYEIPPMEEADNGTLGLIKGTYNVASANNTLVDIVGGEIVNIYIKDETNTYRNIREYLNTNADNIAKIIAGTTVVAKALSATNDKFGNDITQTYLTINAGVTKTQMKDYALPRVFNDVNFFTDDGYSDTPPTDITPIYSLEKQAGIIGDFEIFSADKVLENVTFQLSNKNSYTDTIFVRANENCSVQFRLTTELYVNNDWVTANVELTDMVDLIINQIKKVSFGSTFNSLDYSVTLESGDTIRQTLEVVVTTSDAITFDIFSNDIYPSTFYLNTTTTTILLESGKLGELPTYNITGAIDVLNNKIIFTLPNDSDISNNVQALFILGLPSNTTITDDTKLELSYNSQTIQIFTPSTIGTNIPATVGSMSSKFAPNLSMSGKWVFTGVFQVDGAFIDLIADVDDLSTKANTSTIADAFSTSNTYAVGDIVIFNNTLYICTTAVSTAGAWDSSKWTATSVGELLALKANNNNVITLDTTVNQFAGMKTIRLNGPGYTNGSLTIQNKAGNSLLAISKNNSGNDLESTMTLTHSSGNWATIYLTNNFTKTYFQLKQGNDRINYYFPKKEGHFALEEQLAPQFSTTSTYAVGDLVWYGDDLYICHTAITTAGAWNSTNWTAVNLKDLLDAKINTSGSVLVDRGYISDFNYVPSPLVSGMYYFDTNTANRPDVLYNDKGIVYYIVNEGADRFFQFAFSSYFSGKPFSGAMRSYRNNAYEDWSKIRFAGNCNATIQLKITADVSLTTTDDIVLTNLAKDVAVNQNSFFTLDNDNKTITIGKDVTTIKITTLYQLYQNSTATRFVSVILKNGNSGGTPKGYISSASNYQFSRQQIIQEKVFGGLVEGDKFTFAVKSENTDANNPDVLRKDETRIIIEVIR